MLAFQRKKIQKNLCWEGFYKGSYMSVFLKLSLEAVHILRNQGRPPMSSNIIKVRIPPPPPSPQVSMTKNSN